MRKPLALSSVPHKDPTVLGIQNHAFLHQVPPVRDSLSIGWHQVVPTQCQDYQKSWPLCMGFVCSACVSRSLSSWNASESELNLLHRRPTVAWSRVSEKTQVAHPKTSFEASPRKVRRLDAFGRAESI